MIRPRMAFTIRGMGLPHYGELAGFATRKGASVDIRGVGTAMVHKAGCTRLRDLNRLGRLTKEIQWTTWSTMTVKPWRRQ